MLRMCSFCMRGEVCAWGGLLATSLTIFFLHFEERLEVGFVVVVRSPYGDAADEVGVDVGVVKFLHGCDREEFGYVSEAVGDWL